MKKRNILHRILAVVLVLTMATGLTAQAKGDASSTSLKEAQKEKAALEKQLKAAKELINDLKDSKGDVEDKVQELNNELVDISSKITSLENQLADKSTEMDAQFERFGEWLKHKTGSDGDFMNRNLTRSVIV